MLFNFQGSQNLLLMTHCRFCVSTSSASPAPSSINKWMVPCSGIDPFAQNLFYRTNLYFWTYPLRAVHNMFLFLIRDNVFFSIFRRIYLSATVSILSTLAFFVKNFLRYFLADQKNYLYLFSDIHYLNINTAFCQGLEAVFW